MDFLLIVFLTLLNGVFAMSELALASSRKARLAAMDEAGDKGAQAALQLLEEPTQFLSTVQVGITSIGVLNGIVGEAAFSADLATHLVVWGLTESVAGITATAIVVTIITFTTIIFGELVPKRIGQLYPEAVARLVARPMGALAKAAGPFVKLLSLSTQGMLKLMRIDSKGSRAVTEEEITASLEEGVDAGLIEEHEHQMVRNVFHLDDRPLTSMMTPRSDIQWLDASLNRQQAMLRVNQMRGDGNHSWYPVCRENLGHVLGVISLSHLLSLPIDDVQPIERHAQTAHFVPETLTGMELLEQMRDHSSRMLFVVDEYGEVQGLLTPLDLLEAITGELKPETHSDAWATEGEHGVWSLDGLMPVNELRARLDIKELPAEDKNLYNTLAGLLMFVSGDLPHIGQQVVVGPWRFEIMELDGRRIDKVKAQIAA
ncbi:MAG: HlyC/CorC family transporter [Limnohabitans sp.]|nr:HlyC/CorC family transporter [Limnohabitans sp.]